MCNMFSRFNDTIIIILKTDANDPDSVAYSERLMFSWSVFRVIAFEKLVRPLQRE
jgi:hypothetical protein